MGLGKDIIRVRKDVAGIDLSTELVVFRFDSFSINGARISDGSFWARGPRLIGNRC